MTHINDDLVEIAHKWIGLWQGGDLITFDEIHHPEFIDHSPSSRAQDRDGFKEGIKELYRAFPDFEGKIEDVVIDSTSGKVSIRWTAIGTHQGEFFGVPATGQRIHFAGIEIIEIREDQIIARWGEWDGLDIKEQLSSAIQNNNRDQASVRRWKSASPYEAKVGFCRALRSGDRILVSGTAPIGSDGKTVAPGDAYAQAKRCFEILDEAVLQLGGQRSDIVRTRIYLTRRSDWEAVARAHGEIFGQICPVSTFVVVAELLDPEWLLEIEAEAIVSPKSPPAKKSQRTF